MIEDIKDFTKNALRDSTQFKNIVTTSDNRWADYDASPPSAAYAVKINDVENADLMGNVLIITVRILILISDHSQQRGTEKFINLHSRFTGQYVEFSEPDKFVMEDVFQKVAQSPEVLVNLPNDYSFGIEYQGKVTVDTTL